ncbi:MAG TPA: hypothetical protein VIV66_03495 [Pyrinomonadaceae bacterium]
MRDTSVAYHKPVERLGHEFDTYYGLWPVEKVPDISIGSLIFVDVPA